MTTVTVYGYRCPCGQSGVVQLPQGGIMVLRCASCGGEFGHGTSEPVVLYEYEQPVPEKEPGMLVYVCKDGHVNGDLGEIGCVECYGSTRPVRVVPMEDVRRLYEAVPAYALSADPLPPDGVDLLMELRAAHEEFPAPAEWAGWPDAG